VIHIEDILLWAMAQDGDRYIFGYEIPLGVDNPPASDCSELVEFACNRAGLTTPVMPDGSWVQVRHCRNFGRLIPVTEAMNTRGALLFRFDGNPFDGGRPRSAHVGFSLGAFDPAMGAFKTIEARGTAWGVGVWSSIDRGWTHAGLIPGADYHTDHKPFPPLELDMPLTERDLNLIGQEIDNRLDRKFWRGERPDQGGNGTDDPHINMNRIDEAVRDGKGASAFTAAQDASNDTGEILKKLG
jgi:hypothetical protein